MFELITLLFFTGLLAPLFELLVGLVPRASSFIDQIPAAVM